MTRPGIEPLIRESTPSIIARKLRRAVGDGVLAPGAQLSEASLARELGVSRGPLREAMQRLTQEGLLKSIRNRGIFVATFTEAGIRDMYVARAAIERAAAAVIMQTDPEGAGAALREVINAADVAPSEDAVREADFRFHVLLVELSGSAHLIRMHHTLITETQMCITALADTYPDVDVRLPEHRDIAAEISAGRGDEVDRLIVAHMDDGIHRLAPGQDGVPGPVPLRRAVDGCPVTRE
ncbi:DNA-binding GntR family transcriptional regulator [Spelaeicoccus albus]|uniref:DNA-binding GntR family transcriptional regulator n=2 Tax=Spelaeicoccus albus TaxID=1280376 RepID=A0A7Z0CZV8_9MICO|nr:GntR family transcriptional regulator [Spelaeicoccus albus]NYI66639.1 DNA-binding GntR family transcriptional regulator [Spelaeicoccus albus]